MEWEPRTAMRDMGSQWKRYGHSNAYLRWVHRNDDLSRGEHSSARLSAGEAWTTVRAELGRPVSELAANALVGLAFQYGFISAWLKRSEFEMPVPFDVIPTLDNG
jgi:hypothetical protein